MNIPRFAAVFTLMEPSFTNPTVAMRGVVDHGLINYTLSDYEDRNRCRWFSMASQGA